MTTDEAFKFIESIPQDFGDCEHDRNTQLGAAIQAGYLLALTRLKVAAVQLPKPPTPNIN